METTASSIYVPLDVSRSKMALVELIYGGIYRHYRFHYIAGDNRANLLAVPSGAYRIHVEHGVPRDNLTRLLERKRASLDSEGRP